MEHLEGGVAHSGRVVRDGDVVLRPAPPNVTTTHRFLDHLARRGFRAPRPVAVRSDGHEVVSYVPGEVSIPPYSEEWARSDGALVSVGRLLRAFHQAVEDFVVGDEAEWSVELADPSGGPVVCHNDVCIENVVFAQGQAVGLLDFDFAAPGRPEWDVVMAARYWVPLLDPESAAATGRHLLDPFDRVRLFADAYGLAEAPRRSFMTLLLEIEDVALAFVEARMERGDESFMRMWDALGGRKRFDRKMTWLRANHGRFEEALLR